MESSTSSKNSTVKNSLLPEENANLSAFRRRNKILILILLSLIISLIVIICAIIAFHIQITSPNSTNPALEAFCAVSNDTSSCLNTLETAIGPKSRTEPNQIFTLCLRNAAKELQNTIPLISSKSNCTVSLREGLSRIGEAVAAMRVNPFLEVQSDEQRSEMMSWINEAEEDLRSCLSDLDQAEESKAVTAATKKVLQAKEYVNNCQDFLRSYAAALRFFRRGIYVVEVGGRPNMIVQNLSLLSIGGAMWLFVLCLFLALFRIR